MLLPICFFFFFFFNDTATTEIYTLSLHDALPILAMRVEECSEKAAQIAHHKFWFTGRGDRKSTRLNSSHGYISYAVFCLKKKKQYGCDCPIAGSTLTCCTGRKPG